MSRPSGSTPSADAPSLDAPAADAARCRSCAARVRPDEEWCSLCLTPVRVPAAAGPAPEPAAERDDDGADAAPDGGDDTDGAGDGTRPDGPDPEAVAAAGEAAERLLAELSVIEAGTGVPSPLRRLRGEGALGGLLLALAAGGLVLIVVIGLLTLTGAVL